MHHALAAVGQSTVFQSAAQPYLAVDAAWVIRAVNQRYLEATGQARDDLLGRFIFDAFPDNPEDETADGTQNLAASFESVLRSAQRRYMLVQRYDVRPAGSAKEFMLRYWSPVNEPICDDLSGRVVGVLHSVEDVTACWAPMLGHRLSGPDTGDLDAGDAERGRILGLAVRRNELARRQLTLETTQLQTALESRVIIEQAKVILAARENIAPHAAFEILRQRARSTRRSLRVLAQQIVLAEYADRPAIPTQRRDH
jgi:PAS domain S-box-containing protein